ncbi:hypothetical protein DFH09DRAFT_1348086 [Mycena vulgaris]|nr:hypothetical protein DFH09DRAFT_1348086 [Mycena vulgaris]
MARTSMTAKKSTGGPAPKKALGQVDAARPTTTTPASTRRRPPRKGKWKGKRRRRRTKAAVPTAQEWCAGCENGGTMYACALCNRYMCDQCLDFLPPDQMASPNVAWYCPKCWLRGDNIPHWKEKGNPKNGSRGMGYYVRLWRNGKPIDRPMTLAAPQTMRALWPICDTSPLAVIVAAARWHASPMRSRRADRQPPGPRITPSRPFFFESINYKSGHRSHRLPRNIAALTSAWSDINPKRIVVRPHHAHGAGQRDEPHGAGRPPPRTTLLGAFPPSFNSLRLTSPTRFSLASSPNRCAGLIPQRQDLDADPAGVRRALKTRARRAKPGFSQFVNSSGFQSAFAFSVAEFLPSAANTFLMDVFTDIIVYLPLLRVFRYAWSHPSTRPYGTPIRRQCGNPKCLSLASLKIEEYTEDEVVLRCTHCTEDTTYERGNLFLLEGIWDGARRTIQGACELPTVRCVGLPLTNRTGIQDAGGIRRRGTVEGAYETTPALATPASGLNGTPIYGAPSRPKLGIHTQVDPGVTASTWPGIHGDGESGRESDGGPSGSTRADPRVDWSDAAGWLPLLTRLYSGRGYSLLRRALALDFRTNLTRPTRCALLEHPLSFCSWQQPRFSAGNRISVSKNHESMVRHNVSSAAPPLTVAQLQISRRSRGFARAGVGRVSSVALVTALPAPPRGSNCFVPPMVGSSAPRGPSPRADTPYVLPSSRITLH